MSLSLSHSLSFSPFDVQLVCLMRLPSKYLTRKQKCILEGEGKFIKDNLSLSLSLSLYQNIQNETLWYFSILERQIYKFNNVTMHQIDPNCNFHIFLIIWKKRWCVYSREPAILSSDSIFRFLFFILHLDPLFSAKVGGTQLGFVFSPNRQVEDLISLLQMNNTELSNSNIWLGKLRGFKVVKT
jgi:hypothetical protein